MNRRRHLFTGLITAGGTVDAALRVRALVHGDVNLFQFSRARLLCGHQRRLIRIPSDKIIDIQLCKLLVELRQPLFRGQALAEGVALIALFAGLPDPLQFIERIVRSGLLLLHARSVNTSFRTVERVHHKGQFFLAKHPSLIIAQKFIGMFFAFDLPDKDILAAEPVNIFLQAARHGINGAETILDLICHRGAGNVVLPHICHQMIECHIIGHIAAAVRIVNLVLLRNTRADKGKLVRHLHILLHIDRATHHRGMHRHQIGEKFRQILFYVAHHRGTGL